VIISVELCQCYVGYCFRSWLYSRLQVNVTILTIFFVIFNLSRVAIVGVEPLTFLVLEPNP
jgi:hypothetical protein